MHFAHDWIEQTKLSPYTALKTTHIPGQTPEGGKMNLHSDLNSALPTVV
jgi:hypothetical protein